MLRELSLAAQRLQPLSSAAEIPEEQRTALETVLRLTNAVAQGLEVP